jgi:phage regulator Rha-like protein
MTKKKHEISRARIESSILIVRGQKIMLDRDLAELYGVETKTLKRAVKRNSGRFPEDFMFLLSGKEVTNLRYQFGTSSWGGTRYQPMAFTEQGVAMLSSVLNTDRAIQVNIEIMRAFVKLRRILSAHHELARKLAQLEKRMGDHDEQIQAIFEAIRRLMEPPPAPPKRPIGFGVKERGVRYVARKKK